MFHVWWFEALVISKLVNFVTIFDHRDAVVKNIAKIEGVFDTRGGLHPPLPRFRAYGAFREGR
ncbi:MAG: hypothetical protein IPN29_21180 [Saprospiraceae bacterium]|nr:hypothetical protein [Saprospiraceae bacterium]